MSKYSTQSIHIGNRSILLSLVISTLALAFIVQTALADMGPKPGMDFEFVLPEGDSLVITSGVLLECMDPDCQDAQPLAEMGPQRFGCQELECTAMAYGFSDYHRLQIVFTDGVTRQSQVFEKKYFNARYKVYIRGEDLLVEEMAGGFNPMLIAFAAGLLGYLVFTITVVCLVVFYLVFVFRERKGSAAYRDGVALYWLSWLVIGGTAVGSLFLSWDYFLTLLVESLLLVLMLRWVKAPLLQSLTLVLIINTLTQPGLTLLLHSASVSSTYFLGLVIGEVVVCLIESGLIYLGLQKSLTLKKAFIISLVLNLASFLLGLVLPVV